MDMDLSLWKGKREVKIVLKEVNEQGNNMIFSNCIILDASSDSISFFDKFGKMKMYSSDEIKEVKEE